MTPREGTWASHAVKGGSEGRVETWAVVVLHWLDAAAAKWSTNSAGVTEDGGGGGEGEEVRGRARGRSGHDASQQTELSPKRGGRHPGRHQHPTPAIASKAAISRE
jgi:hypothetical protein